MSRGERPSRTTVVGWALLLILALVVLVGLALGASLWPRLRGVESARVEAPRGPVAVGAEAPASFAAIVEDVAPAVVSILPPPVPPPSPEADDGKGGKDRNNGKNGKHGKETKDGTERAPPAASESPPQAVSGFLFTPDGYILTSAAAVPAGVNTLEVAMRDGAHRVGRVVAIDPPSGLAVIKVAGDRFPYLRFSREVARLGDWGLLVGNDGEAVQVAAALVARLQPPRPRTVNYLLFEGRLDGPFNGAPVVDVRGRVSAIIARSAAADSAQAPVYGVPAGLAEVVATQLSRRGFVARGYPQATVQDLTPSLIERLSLPSPKAVLVDEVPPSSPAGLGGLRPGDVVVAVNGQPVGNTDDYLRLAGRPDGQPLKLQVLRAGEQLTLTIPPPPPAPAAAPSENQPKTEKSAGSPPRRSRR